MGRPANRRHKMIVNKPLQHRVMITTMWLPCLCLVAASFCLALYCSRLHHEAMVSDAELPSIVPVFVSSASFVILAAVFTVLHGLRLSQRIAGPMVNFRNTLGRVKDGDLTARVHLRKLDLLTDAADHINDFLDWLEEHPPEGVQRLEDVEPETVQAAD